MVGPAMVALARGGIFAQLSGDLWIWDTLGGNRASLALIFDLLEIQGWIVRRAPIVLASRRVGSMRLKIGNRME